MKKTQKWMISVVIVGLVTSLLSWNQFGDPRQADPAYFKNASNQNVDQSSFEANLIASAEDDDRFGSPSGSHKWLPGQDVLIQKIQGDNSHVLMMAFYSKENYPGPSVTIENNGQLIFKDDGKEYDKQAGDGLYTAKVAVDVNQFIQQAASMTAQMKKIGYKPIRFEHRAMIVDPDADASFDMQKWATGEAVSISGLTNALGDLDPSDNAASSGNSAPTILSGNSASTFSGDAASAKLNSIRNNCVTITNLAVVEDPARTWNPCAQTGTFDGPWTFNTIMRQLASPDPAHPATDAQVSTFVKNWLGKWASPQTVNGDVVAARTTVNTRILNPWITKSQNAGGPTGQLDMHFAPFKLVAIVNRFDLRQGGLHGILQGPGSAVGEGRYVFCLLNSTCTDKLQMGVILEFGVNKPNTCDARKAWAQQWVSLRTLTIGSSQYNQALQAITDQYSLCGSDPSRPNQSSLDQLRTNEIALSSPWEMREFVLDANGSLKQNTVAQNPADKYNAQVINTDVQTMASYVNQNTGSIKADTFTVPLTWQGVPFLGGAAKLVNTSTNQPVPPTGQPPAPFHWDGTSSSNPPTFIKNDVARFDFSLQTCWSCHGGETQTGFTHIDPVFFGTEATISGFVSGTAGGNGAIDFDNNATNDSMAVKDPALRPSANPKIRIFNEKLRRARDLNAATATTCGSALSISADLLFKPLNSPD